MNTSKASKKKVNAILWKLMDIEYSYFAKIIEILPTVQQFRPQWSRSQIFNHSSNSGTDDEVEVPRQPNGRLRFPDAFLHPTVSETDLTTGERENLVLVDVRQYKIQLIDHIGQPLEDCTRIVNDYQVRREKHSFTRLNIQSFIRECTFKESYVNAPWLIKVNNSWFYYKFPNNPRLSFTAVHCSDLQLG
jgi:bromodomain adjacent to zinc finger domain protein 1A